MLYRVIEDENHNLVTEALAGTPLVAFDDTLDDTSENAVQNKVITEALDTKLTKPDGTLVCWPNNALLKWDETSEELVPVATPTVDGTALIASLTPQTVTVYSTGGGTFYDVNFNTVSEPSGTAGIPTQIGDFFEYNGTWYRKDGSDYYEVTSFTDAGTIVTDAALIADLDTKVFFTYSSVVYTQATSNVSYAWDTIGIGCKWTSTDTYACIETCDACSLAHLSNNCVSLGNADIYAKVCCDCIDIKGCTAAVNVGADKVAIGASATGTACSVVIGCGASVSCAGGIAIGRGAAATCGIDIKSPNAEVCINAQTGGTSIGSNIVIHCDTNTAIGSHIGIGNGVTDSVIIGQSNTIIDGCTLNGVSIIGDLGELGVDYTETVSSGDVVIGVYDCNPFHYCASNGYTYSGSKLMTGRILNCAAELPATNCDLLLYYVP